MIIIGYESVDGVPFGASVDTAKAAFGEPKRQRTNNLKELALHYDGFILRFRPGTLSLREVTLLPGSLGTVNGAPVGWDESFLRWACTADGAPRESAGFIVCDHLGIAMTGFHDGDQSQLAISCYSRHDWDQFFAEAVPFTP